MLETWPELTRRITAEEHALEAMKRSENTRSIASFALWETYLGVDGRTHYVKLSVRVDGRYPYAGMGGNTTVGGGE